MRLIMFILFTVFSVYYSFTASGLQPIPVSKVRAKTAETRKAQAQVSKSLYAKLKAQALNEARAELAAETEALERAKLEALQELDAGATDVSEPRPAGAE